jgi:hypothetical protein
MVGYGVLQNANLVNGGGGVGGWKRIVSVISWLNSTYCNPPSYSL